MSVTLLNLRTNSVQTVSPHRIELLNGGDLISLHNLSDIFEVMARANRLQRNTFQKGNTSAHYKYIDYLLSNENHEKKDDIAAENDIGPDSEMHAPYGTGWSDQDNKGSDNIDEGSYSTYVGSAGIGDSSQGQEIAQPARYKLRNRNIYCMSLCRQKPKYYSNLSIGNLQDIKQQKTHYVVIMQYVNW